MNVTLRPFTPDDYAPAVALMNLVFPEYGDTVDEWRHHDDHVPAKCLNERVVAVAESGAVVGLGSAQQSDGAYHPRKFEISVTVDPNRRREGIGALLYDRLRDDTARLDPIVILGTVREDMPEAAAFAAARGFHEIMRHWENHLELARYDPEVFADVRPRVRATGIGLTSMAALEADPARNRKIYDMVEDINKDVPSPVERTARDFETWEERSFSNPHLIPEAFMIAVDEDSGEYVGVSNMWRHATAADEIYTGLTGVRRPYRRRGVALALKLEALDWSRAHGIRLVRTWNASHNEGMLAINDQLGFVKKPAWINLELRLAPEE